MTSSSGINVSNQTSVNLFERVKKKPDIRKFVISYVETELTQFCADRIQHFETIQVFSL